MRDASALVEAFDIESYLSAHGFEPLGVRGRTEWLGTCPDCGRQKLCVDVNKRAYHCWICEQYMDTWVGGQLRRRPVRGAGGLIALIRVLDSVSAADAIRLLEEGARRSLQDFGDLPTPSLPPSLRAVEVLLPAGAVPVTTVLPYMQKRGLTLEDATRLGLYYCPPGSGRYADRLVFPVWEQGRPVYWQARAMYEENDYRGPGKFRKVLNPERLPGQLASSELLLNLETAARYSRVVIVEGPMDAARTGADAVCTFGKKITSAQVRRLLDHGVKAVDLMWDGPKLPNEPQGTLAEMLGVAPLLRTYFDLRIVELPFGDPAEWSREHLVYFRAHAKSTFFSHTFTSL